MGRVLASLLSLALLPACSPALNAGLLRDEPVLSRDLAAPELALLHFRLTADLRAGRLADATICTGTGQGERAVPLGGDREQRLMIVLPFVAPYSRCELLADNTRRDTITGERAVLVDVHQLVCKTPEDCTAWAGAREYGWAHYRLRFVRGAWQIGIVPADIVLT